MYQSQLKFLLLNGPNLNLLGERETHIYGETTLAELHSTLSDKATSLHLALSCKQSNHEGELVDWIQACRVTGASPVDGIIINPGAYTHTSVAIRDAIMACQCPTVEVHISQLAKRDSFRHHSFVSDVVLGTVSGFGIYGYELALLALVNHLQISDIQHTPA
jgi:3-dehydroquinate dehydratase II